MIPAELLLEGYRTGIFPMAMDGGEIGWFSPDPRAIIPLETFHVPHGLRRALRKNLFETRIDGCFERVVRECAARDETWISEIIVRSYCNLNRLGFAHSIEAWRDGELAGGLYGVSLGAAFFGESMFHSVTDASKVALNFLVETLRRSGFRLLEVQWLTPHLESFGAIEIPRDEYLKRLAACTDGVPVRKELILPGAAPF
jgi:leucyl/phenylalanyl-tRNA---protein transferase